jgi:CRISPR/Cas system-associated exonuclease Cas4 (RecB family)
LKRPVMKTFLDELAQHLLLNHKSNLRNICLVLPNRRAGLFLKKSLSGIAGKTIWSPEIYSIEDFLIKISGLNKMDQIALVFELYEIHKQIKNQDTQDFEQFSKWGQVMLSDFNEIDMHLIDAKNLYGYLNEVKAIEKWNPDGRPLTATEKNYLEFFKSLHAYYHLLQNRLMEKKSGYQGMIYRHVAGNIEKAIGEFKWDKIYFAGFNALTKAEEKVIDYLSENRHAEILRDVDAYYIDDPNQEAGEFLRKQLEKEGRVKFGRVNTFFKDSKKEITIHGVPGNEGQASISGRLIQDFLGTEDNSLENTAIVLADEGLLIPVLNAIPDQVKALNITMGYPIRLTQPFTFFIILLRLYENTSRFSKIDQAEQKGFYFRDILRLLSHSLVTGFFNTQKQISEINASKQVFYPPDEMLKLSGDKHFSILLQHIFSDTIPSPSKIIENIAGIIGLFRELMQTRLKANADDRETKLQLEYLYHTSTILNRIRDLNQAYQSITSVKLLKDLFRQISSLTRIPFTGEPLKGLQIMGMLETRNLDFKRIILISANEGKLPASTMGNSLIPYDIQVEMNLPTHNQKNAVFAYHFYRLIQRAEEVHIIYNTEPDQLGGGEQSRYIQQINNELEAYNPKITIREVVESLPPPSSISSQNIEITKTDDVFAKLMERAAKGFSPTSLNQFRKCPLQFYFQHVAGINESEEVEENLEYRTIGSIVHQVLEDMFRPFVGKTVHADDVRLMIRNAGQFIKNAFEKHYSKGQVRFGKNRLIYEVISNFIHTYLEFELKALSTAGVPLIIKGLEQKVLTDNISMLFPGLENHDIRLKGFIDRLDLFGETIRIIDYKTGKVENRSDLYIKDFTDFEEGNKKDKAFQVMMYAWLYNLTHPGQNRNITTGIISLPKLTNELMNFGVKEGTKTDYNIDEEKLESFEQYLIQLMGEIFDRETPFIQTEDEKTCRTCSFKEICNR